jgi:hypothetical protein
VSLSPLKQLAKGYVLRGQDHIDEIIGPEGINGFFFYKSKPENPLCPKCWQSPTKKNAVFLTDTDAYGPGYKCIICNFMWDK